MFHSISKRIIAYAVENNTLDKGNIEEYIYGLEISLSVLSSYISIIIIGILLDMLWQSIFFLFIFVTVRRFAGGFHFRSQLMCYTSMCIMSTLVLLTIRYTKDNIIPCSLIMVLSTLLLLILSPIPAIEKPLDEKEKVIYGRISRIILIIIASVYIVLCFFQHIYTAKIISVTICVVAIFAILGIIKHKLYEHEKAAL